jgi:tetratricopeptide (TPR) repeat protein
MSRTIACLLLCLPCLTVAGGLAGCQSTPESVASSGDPAVPTEEQARRMAEAKALTASGRYDDALGIFQDILAENPMITQAYLGIGEIYMVTDDYESAEPAYRRAARLEPRSFEAQYGHGLALQMLQRFVDAVRAYQRALTIKPDDPKTNLNIATTYLQMERADEAIGYAQKAVELAPSNGGAYANLGAVYERLGYYEESVDAYIKALEIMGNRPPLMLNLVNVQAQLSRYAEAANTAKTLIRIEPSAAAYERLGWCAFKLRDYDLSRESSHSAVDLDPDYWPAWNGIGVNALNTWLLSKKRDTAAQLEARDAFRESLRANPEQMRLVQLMSNYKL